MSDALFSTVELGDSARAGYRLHRIEVFNWGTFDQRVWSLAPEGDTALLTGDIGSGKSTLVDAVTTLLLPAHRIAYNKAAGAESKERTLRSYVQGHFKSERIESTGTSRAVGLRDHRSYSVILGVFVNEGHGETVTLAQVFHQGDRSGQPDRFFVTASTQLSVEADFTGFGPDLAQLRRRLRDGGATLSTVFPEYSRQLRRLLGIRSDQALDLFHQTVSMKSVGNLNEFVRNHMLEPVDASDRITGIVGHFEDLIKAHEAIRRARDQLAALEPLVATSARYDEALARRAALQLQRDAVRLFFAELRVSLLTEQIEVQDRDREQLRGEYAEGEVTRERLGSTREQLIADRAAAGGDRVGELQRAEADAHRDAQTRAARRDQFTLHVQAAGIEPVTDAASFAALTARLGDLVADARAQRSAIDAALVDQGTRRAQLRRRCEETTAELDSLAARTDNLPSSHLDLREQLCDELRLDPASLPFAGELIDVADGFEQWRGAAERVLRGFALSLLVRQDHYSEVSRWINERRLTYRGRGGERRGLRLVYERVPHRQVRLQPLSTAEGPLLAHTLVVADGPFEDYVHDQLGRRASHRCTQTMEEFRTAQRAVTVEGQVRSGDRHEKDDRSRVDDPRTWVLGWANTRKVEALRAQLAEQQSQLLAIETELTSTSAERDRLGVRMSALDKLETYAAWGELDWEDAQARADSARQERERLLGGSSRLAEIERRLQENRGQLDDLDERLQEVHGRISILSDRVDRASTARTQESTYVAAVPATIVATARGAYEQLGARLGADLPTDADRCQDAAAELTGSLQQGIDRIGRELGGYSQSLLGYMNDVRRRWPEATTEMDASVEARGSFLAFHEQVATDDLPAFEDEFKHQLNTNTIRELAGFNSWLRRQAEDIHTRVDRINEALGAIDYTAGRYITLVAERTVNQDIQAFRSELRAATDDSLGPADDRYSEQHFLDVQRIIERFRGRPNHSDADKAWTRRVTDVRNWFSFSASERDRDTGKEWEHYRDSDGKSGGQKEKLAYTILAASLAYQFGLEWGAQKSRDFRFAVIDEAFGRGSDASTRYALELFAKLGLQLLIVTPLQKVHVIEPYVRAIGFVDNPTGSCSRLQTLTIEEFRERRDGSS